MAAWKGRSDLEKEMRKANDRLRALEAHGETAVPAYKEAIRLMRNATGDPNERVPRFRRSDYKSEAELRKAIKKFTGTKTSTIPGVRKMATKAQTTYGRSATAFAQAKWQAAKDAGLPVGPEPEQITLTKSEAKTVGNIWEGIRKNNTKYDKAADLEVQKLVLKGAKSGASADVISDIILKIRNDENLQLNDWEEAFDVDLENFLNPKNQEDGENDDTLYT